MKLVTVSLGSNIEPVRHIRYCLDALADTFGALQISRVFESEPVGFIDNRNFYNLVVAFHSDWSPGELQAWSKQLEIAHGRRANTAKFSPRALDIDLLTVGSLCGTIDGVTLPRAILPMGHYGKPSSSVVSACGQSILAGGAAGSPRRMRHPGWPRRADNRLLNRFRDGLPTPCAYRLTQRCTLISFGN